MTNLKLVNDKEVQTRDEDGAIRFFQTIKEAFGYAERHPGVWKVSWSDSDTHERLRFVRTVSGDWKYDPIELAVARHPSNGPARDLN